MYLTSVLIVLDEYFQGIDCFHDAINRAGAKCEILVYNNGCSDPSIVSSIQEVSTYYQSHNSMIEASYSECVNSLLCLAQGDYICIMHSVGYLEDDWIVKMKESQERIFKSGIVYVHEVDQAEFSDYALNQKDELEPIQNNDNKVQNILFFKKQFLSIVGGLHNNLCSNSAIAHFARRFYFSGFTNYSIPGNTMIRVHTYTDTVRSSQAEYKSSIESLNRSKEYFLPIVVKSAKHEALIEALSEFGESLFSHKLGAVVLTQHKINHPDLIKLNEIATQIGSSIEILPASYYDNNVLKNRILLVFR